MRAKIEILIRPQSRFWLVRFRVNLCHCERPTSTARLARAPHALFDLIISLPWRSSNIFFNLFDEKIHTNATPSTCKIKNNTDYHHLTHYTYTLWIFFSLDHKRGFMIKWKAHNSRACKVCDPECRISVDWFTGCLAQQLIVRFVGGFENFNWHLTYLCTIHSVFGIIWTWRATIGCGQMFTAIEWSPCMYICTLQMQTFANNFIVALQHNQDWRDLQ